MNIFLFSDIYVPLIIINARIDKGLKNKVSQSIASPSFALKIKKNLSLSKTELKSVVKIGQLFTVTYKIGQF